MNAIRFSFFTVFSEGLNSVGKVSFKSTFSIKDRGHPSILVTSLSEKEPAIFKKTGTAKDFERLGRSCFVDVSSHIRDFKIRDATAVRRGRK